MRACTECWKALSELNGFLYATGEELDTTCVQLLQITETRYALETEGIAIAPIRLFEALASENYLNEPMATQIFELNNKAMQIRQINLNTLNLHLPFLPASGRLLQQSNQLKKEIADKLSAPSGSDPLILMALLYGYVVAHRAVVKYGYFNAGVLVNRWMYEHQQIPLPLLPLSEIIRQERRDAEPLLIEAFETGAMQNWILYFLNLTARASRRRMEQLSALLQLKRANYDMIEKYTPYALPAADLNVLLFSKPFIKAADIIRQTACHRQTAHTYLHHLEKLGLLIEKRSGREKLYMNKRLLDILMAG